MQPVDVMRNAKHAAHVRRKRARFAYRRHKFALATRLFRDLDVRRRWRYRPQRYASTFLHHDAPPQPPSHFPARVFVLWTGDNDLTANRATNLARLRAELDLTVVLVTPDNLSDWVVDGHPLHPAYDHLSLVHRSDYLRGYLLHHHGGGYADVKAPRGSWRGAYEQMARDPAAWVTGYETTDAGWIGRLRGRLGLDILVNYRLMFGKGALLMRSHTPLTAEWLHEMDRRLDCSAAQLRTLPGSGADTSELYPLSWTDLLGRVLDPLTLKHHHHVRHDDRLLLEFEDYR